MIHDKYIYARMYACDIFLHTQALYKKKKKFWKTNERHRRYHFIEKSTQYESNKILVFRVCTSIYMNENKRQTQA